MPTVEAIRREAACESEGAHTIRISGLSGMRTELLHGTARNLVPLATSSTTEWPIQIEHGFDLQRLASDHVLEGLPLQQFHGDEGSPIGFVNLVNRADVRVVQRGCGFGFPLKSAQGLRVVSKMVGKKLQRDVPTQL